MKFKVIAEHILMKTNLNVPSMLWCSSTSWFFGGWRAVVVVGGGDLSLTWQNIVGLLRRESERASEEARRRSSWPVPVTSHDEWIGFTSIWCWASVIGSFSHHGSTQGLTIKTPGGLLLPGCGLWPTVNILLLCWLSLTNQFKLLNSRWSTEQTGWKKQRVQNCRWKTLELLFVRIFSSKENPEGLFLTDLFSVLHEVK